MINLNKLCCPMLCVPAGHSCEHELETARINGVLGNMDANTGDHLIGIESPLPARETLSANSLP